MFLPKNKNLLKVLYIFLFVVILIVGCFLVFHKLSLIPAGFYIDEALPAYNAYSLLLTGRDEYGKFLPLFLRFYGSYNQPLYTYLTILPIAKFGLSVFSARFVAGLSGLLTGIVIFGILRSSGFVKNRIVSYIGMFLFLISPWTILYSRVGYEISLGLFLFSAGAYFCCLGLKKGHFLLAGMLFLSLSTYASYGERFLAPIFIVVFFLVFRQQLLSKHKKYLKVTVIAGFLTQIPNFWLLTTPAFFPKGDLFYKSESFGFLIKDVLSHYTTYFSPRSLFFLGDPDLQRSIPELSVFYPWMVVPFFVGLFVFVKARKYDFAKFVFILLAVSPIPAAFTHDPFSTHRAITLLTPMIIVITAGVDVVYQKVNRLVFFVIFTLVILFSFVLLYRSYFVFLPQERAVAWEYGFDKLAAYISSHPDDHFVVDQTRIKPAYINLAFFMAYPPDKLQETVDPSIRNNYYANGKFDPYYKFANVETRNVDWRKDVYEKKILVGDEFTISIVQAKEHFLIKVFEIRDPVGGIVFEGYETNPKLKCGSFVNKDIYCK